MGTKANLPSNLLGRDNVRKIAFVGLLLGLFTLSAVAAESDHPKAEFFGGYQYTRLEGGVNANGFNLGATANLNNYFGITADLGSSAGLMPWPSSWRYKPSTLSGSRHCPSPSRTAAPAKLSKPSSISTSMSSSLFSRPAASDAIRDGL